MLQTSFPKLKKHSPTRLYMLYPMVQSVALVFVEIVKKMPSQWHCLLPSSPFTIKNHFGVRPHLSVLLLAQPTTPQRANKMPYLQGTGAPRHYQHTLIVHLCLYTILRMLISLAQSQHLYSVYVRQDYYSSLLPACESNLTHIRFVTGYTPTDK
jgi:hypothetical protein